MSYTNHLIAGVAAAAVVGISTSNFGSMVIAFFVAFSLVYAVTSVYKMTCAVSEARQESVTITSDFTEMVPKVKNTVKKSKPKASEKAKTTKSSSAKSKKS